MPSDVCGTCGYETDQYLLPNNGIYAPCPECGLARPWDTIEDEFPTPGEMFIEWVRSKIRWLL